MHSCLRVFRGSVIRPRITDRRRPSCGRGTSMGSRRGVTSAPRRRRTCSEGKRRMRRRRRRGPRRRIRRFRTRTAPSRVNWRQQRLQSNLLVGPLAVRRERHGQIINHLGRPANRPRPPVLIPHVLRARRRLGYQRLHGLVKRINSGGGGVAPMRGGVRPGEKEA